MQKHFQCLLIDTRFPWGGIIKTFHIGFTTVRTLKTLNYMLYFISLCICVYCLSKQCVMREYGGHRKTVKSVLLLPFYVSSVDKFRLLGLSNKNLYLLSHFASPELCIFKK